MKNLIGTFISEIENELKNNILPFWANNAVDPDNGGFYGLITNDLGIEKTAEKGCILNSRILWTYSKAYNVLGDGKYLSVAKVAYDYLIEHLWDQAYSGLYWMTDFRGNATNMRKQVYNLAFGIYGLAEYYKAAKEVGALDKAIELFRLIEEYAFDPQNGGYIEALTHDWQTINDLRLSEKDMNEKKSMNTHLHVLEAYTNLLSVWKSDELQYKLEMLIDTMIKHIIDPNTYHFKLFFDEYWTSKSDHISFGHDIEGSWLLCEAAEAVGSHDLIEKAEAIAIKMAQRAFDEGMDKEYGGMFNEAQQGSLIGTDKTWWVQAEAMVGFLNAYGLTSEDRYLEASRDTWKFVDKYFVDHKNGEWFSEVSRTGKEYDLPKADPWKCPYHNGRACFELMARLRNI